MSEEQQSKSTSKATEMANNVAASTSSAPPVPRYMVHQPSNDDIRRISYQNFATAVASNLLRIRYEPNSGENPIPSLEEECYAKGEKLPPLLTGFFDGDMAYGVSDYPQELYQRRMAALSNAAVVNWFCNHLNTPKKRQNAMNAFTQNIAVGSAVVDAFPMHEDEDEEEYIARLILELNGPKTNSVPEPEPEQVVKAKKVTKPVKETPAPKEAPKPVVKKGSKPAPKKATIQVESDSEESVADLKDDSDDSDLPVSDSDSSLEVSEESEAPKAKKPMGKKKFGRR